MGGEEFAVILPDTPLEGAYAVAEHIRQVIEKGKIRALNKEPDKEEYVGGITISIGIANCDINGNWTDALSKADEALYVSKTRDATRPLCIRARIVTTTPHVLRQHLFCST